MKKVRSPALFIRLDFLLFLKFKYNSQRTIYVNEDAQGNVREAPKAVSKGGSENVLTSWQHHDYVEETIIF